MVLSRWFRWVYMDSRGAAGNSGHLVSDI